MYTVLRGLKWETCFCYDDDTVIFLSTFSQHLKRVKVLECLARAGLQPCCFASNTIKVFGHVVSKKGIQPDPGKIAAVIDFPYPLHIKDLR